MPGAFWYPQLLRVITVHVSSQTLKQMEYSNEKVGSICYEIGHRLLNLGAQKSVFNLQRDENQEAVVTDTSKIESEIRIRASNFLADRNSILQVRIFTSRAAQSTISCNSDLRICTGTSTPA